MQDNMGLDSSTEEHPYIQGHSINKHWGIYSIINWGSVDTFSYHFLHKFSFPSPVASHLTFYNLVNRNVELLLVFLPVS
jgi:hypothetical protein